MKQDATIQVADIIVRALKNSHDDAFLALLKKEVRVLCEVYPIP